MMRLNALLNALCATSRQLDGHGGLYCENCDIAELVPADIARYGVQNWAVDAALADRLWRLSEQLNNLEYDINQSNVSNCKWRQR